MPRKKRFPVPGLPCHVTARGNNRQQLFYSETDYRFYLSLLRSYMALTDLGLYHYCLMPNHVHLMFDKAGPTVSLVMRDTQREFARHFRTKHKQVGHTWQQRFFDVAITDPAALIACGNYIELNPVRKSLVNRAVDWPYSSCRHYLLGKPDSLVANDPLYDSLGATPAGRRSAYLSQLNHAQLTNAVPSAMAVQ